MFIFKILFFVFISCNSYMLAFGETDYNQKDVQYNACYTVKDGDNLWELSNRFKNSEWLWSESKNKRSNLIYPGQKIFVSLKKDFKSYKSPRGDLYKKTEHNYTLNKTRTSNSLYYKYLSIDQVGFITKDTISYVGKVYGGENKQVLIGWNQNIYIKPYRNHFFKEGQIYLILRAYKSVLFKKQNFGINYLPMGLVEINGLKPRYVKARVVKSFRPIQNDDMVVIYEQKDPDIEIITDVPYLKANIISSDFDSHMVSENDIVYINKGQSDGVKIGQVFSIYKNTQKEMHKSRRQVHIDPANSYPCGNLLILSTKRYTSTGIINSALEEIVLSDELIVR